MTLAEQNRLAEQHIDLVGHALKRHRAVFPVSKDDLESAAMFALVQASRRWVPSTGVPFTAYARRRIDGAIVDEIRRIRYGPTHGDAAPQPISTDNYEPASRGEGSPAPADSLARMTPRQRAVASILQAGYSTQEAADRLGISRRGVRGVGHDGAWRAGIAPQPAAGLSERDLRMLSMAALGIPFSDQAAILGMSDEGLRKHRRRVRRKLGARTMDEAVALVREGVPSALVA